MNDESSKYREVFTAIAAGARTAEAFAETHAMVYVPGLWRCAKCEFELIQSNLHHDGIVTARDQPGDRCPNCDSPLWRVTYKDAYVTLMRRFEAYIALHSGERLEAEDIGFEDANARDAWRYRRLRSAPLGVPGVPCIAVPASATSGVYVNAEQADAAVDEAEMPKDDVVVAFVETTPGGSQGLVWADHPANTEGHVFTPLVVGGQMMPKQALVPDGWTGWACQLPDRLPRLYGNRVIAEVNCDTEIGDRLLFLVEAAAPELQS